MVTMTQTNKNDNDSLSRVLDILNSADDVVFQEGNEDHTMMCEDSSSNYSLLCNSLLEPTPIGPNGITVVSSCSGMFAPSSRKKKNYKYAGNSGNDDDKNLVLDANVCFSSSSMIASPQDQVFPSMSSSSSSMSKRQHALYKEQHEEDDHDHQDADSMGLISMMNVRPSKRQCMERMMLFLSPMPQSTSTASFLEFCIHQEDEEEGHQDLLLLLDPVVALEDSANHQPVSSSLTEEGHYHHHHQDLQEEIRSSGSNCCSLSSNNTPARFRSYQADQWMERFQDLVEFQKNNSHCLVPHDFPENNRLSQWIKRQRYQYKLKKMGRHSTLTDDRQVKLENLGFVWDSHKAAWYERLEALKEYRSKHGHCNVPSKYTEDRPLAIWVKCQRRQMKLFRQEGSSTSSTSTSSSSTTKSTMTHERFVALDQLGFDWNPRNLPDF